MRIKADQEQLRGIVIVLAILLTQHKPQRETGSNPDKGAYTTGKLVYSLVKAIYQKLRVKSESTALGCWNFTLNENECLALYSYLYTVGLPSDEKLKYEIIKMQLIMNQLDKEHA